MNIQGRERDVLKKKNLPSALGKIHLLKQPCQDNTELNISLSMLNTFMIQTGKQHQKPIPLSPAPWLVLGSRIKAARLHVWALLDIAAPGFPRRKEGSRRRTPISPKSLIYAFRDRKRNKPAQHIPAWRRKRWVPRAGSGCGGGQGHPHPRCSRSMDYLGQQPPGLDADFWGHPFWKKRS